MADALSQVLLDLGIDLQPLQAAVPAIEAILQRVNSLADQSIDKSSAAAEAQKASYTGAKSAVDDLIRAASQQVEISIKRQEGLERETAELRRQVEEVRNIREEEEKRGGFFSKATGALIGGQTGNIAAAFIGGGIGAGVEAATEGIIKFIERLKEGVLESSKLSSAMDTFEKTARGVGVEPVEFMGKLQVATEGFVNKLDLATLGTRLLGSGIKGLTPDRILEVTKATIELAEANNRSAAQAVGALTRTLTRGGGRNVQMLADVTGIPRQALQLANLTPGLNQAQLSAEGISHAFTVIIAQAAQLGETPKTLEQALVRIKVVVDDLFMSFGKGVNESSGMQFVFGFIKSGAEDISRLEDKFETLGQKAGNALAVIALAGKGVAETLGVMGTSFMQVAHSATVAGDQGSAATSAFETMHPAMAEVVKVFISLNTEIQILAIHLGDVLSFVTRIVTALPPELVGGVAGAAYGARFGPWGAAVGAVTGLGAGHLARGATESTGAPTSLLHSYAPSGTRGMADLMFDYSTSHPEDQSSDAKIARAKAQGEQLWKDIQSSFSQTPVEKGKGSIIPPAEQDEETNRQKEQEVKAQEALNLARIAATEQGVKDLDAVKRTAAEAHLKMVEDQISEEQDKTNAAYKAGEEFLKVHLDNLRDEENKSYEERKANLTARLAAQLGDLVAQRAKITADAAVKIQGIQEDATGMTQKTKDRMIAEQEVTRDSQLQAANAKIQEAATEHHGEMQNQERQHNRTLTGINEQGKADDLGAQRKRAADRLQIQQDSIKDQEALVKEQYQQLQISAVDYYTKLNDLATQSRDLQIQKAAEVYNSSEKNQTTLATYVASVRKAYADLASEQQKYGLAVIPETVKSSAAEYAVQQGRLQQQLTYAQRYPGQNISEGGQSPNQLLAQQSNLYLQQKNYIEGQLPLLEKFGEEYNTQFSLLQKVKQELEDVNTQLATMHSITLGMAAIGVQISAFIGSSFHSKFSQNLADTIGAGSKAVQSINAPNTGLAASLRQAFVYQPGGVTGYPGSKDFATTPPTDKMNSFVTGITAAAKGLADLANSVLNAKTAIAGAFGGGIAGAGLGSAAASATKGMTGILGSLSPFMPGIGAAGGLVAGLITGQKNAKVTAQVNELQTNFKQIMNEFALNTNDLENTIQQLQVLVQQAQAMQSSSKKGSSQFQQVIDQYNQQIMTLKQQQNQVLIKMHEQVAVLEETPGAQNYLNTLQQILEQYQQFAGAAQSAYDLAEANQFLVQSMKDYEQNLVTQLAQDNQQAITDALQLNDLIFQRSQMMLQYSQQVQGLLSQGVLSRQMTRAQTTGSQIEQLTLAYTQQMDQINEQISATQYRVAAEQQIFTLAATRIGLETQLLQLQNAQTNLDMQRISALQNVVDQIAAGTIDPNSPLGQLIAALPAVTNPSGGTGSLSTILPGLLAGGVSTSLPGTTGILDLLVSAAYQGRASAGYGAFRGQNL